MIYFLIFLVRYRAGIVTDKMFGFLKWRFIAIGVLEVHGVAGGMASAGILLSFS